MNQTQLGGFHTTTTAANSGPNNGGITTVVVAHSPIGTDNGDGAQQSREFSPQQMNSLPQNFIVVSQTGNNGNGKCACTNGYACDLPNCVNKFHLTVIFKYLKLVVRGIN